MMDRTIGKASLSIGLVVTLCVAIPARAEGVDDFKRAKAEKGCKSIPYSGYQSTCETKQSGMNDRCKSDDSGYSCRSLGTKQFIETMKQMSEQVRRLDDQKKDQESRRSSSGASDADKAAATSAIEKITKERDEVAGRLDTNKRKLESDINEIKARIERGNNCLEYRVAVQSVFADAKSKARGESDPMIKPIADELISYWVSEEPRHQGSIDKTREAIQFCENARDGKE